MNQPCSLPPDAHGLQEAPIWNLAVTVQLESAMMGERQSTICVQETVRGSCVQMGEVRRFQAGGGTGQILKVREISGLVSSG